MLYIIIHILCTLISNFLYSPYYFILLFLILKDKIKYYVSNISHFLVNSFWLAELVKKTRPNIEYLATKSHLIRELPQSCEMIGKARDLGVIFCPAKKHTSHDGCFYDPKIGDIIKTIQFKLKEEGSFLKFDHLEQWASKYSHLDILDIGFKSSKDFEHYKDKIIDFNNFLSLKGSKLVVTSTDYSSYKLESTCRSDIKDLLDMQASFNGIVKGVNDHMIDSYGLIIAKSQFFI